MHFSQLSFLLSVVHSFLVLYFRNFFYTFFWGYTVRWRLSITKLRANYFRHNGLALIRSYMNQCLLIIKKT
jgi:hypothetical protein